MKKNKKNTTHQLWFFSGAERNGVFASDDVLSGEATSDDGRAGARTRSLAPRHGSSTKLEELKHHQRGYLCFFLSLSEKHGLGVG